MYALLLACEIHDFASDFDALPDGEVGANPTKDEGSKERPHHGTHVMYAGGDLKNIVPVEVIIVRNFSITEYHYLNLKFDIRSLKSEILLETYVYYTFGR